MAPKKKNVAYMIHQALEGELSLWHGSLNCLCVVICLIVLVKWSAYMSSCHGLLNCLHVMIRLTVVVPRFA